MSINKRVKLLREALGKSQEHFGTAIGISKSGVSNIESGIRNVTEKHIKLICVAFPVNESWLRTGEGDMFSSTNNGESLEQLLASLSDDELIKRIIKSYLNLDEAGKIALRKLIDSFLPDDVGQQQEEATPPLELKSPVDMTDEEIDRTAEQIRQEMHGEKEAVAKAPVLPGYGTNGKGPPITGSGGGVAGSATG